METKIIKINPRELKLLELNARYMRHEEFMRLVNNVKKDRKLTSVPFGCLEDDGKYLVLSGNHRTKAAIEAGLEEIEIMVTDEKLDEQQKMAIQLSHNQLAGQDDPDILKQIYEKITDLDMKLYTGLDDKTLELLSKETASSLSEANLEYQTVMLTFLPDELETVKRTFKLAEEGKKGKGEKWLARYKEYDRWLDNIEVAGSSYGVKNVATSLDIILSVFEHNLADLAKGWENQNTKSYVPIASVLGISKIPTPIAKKLNKVTEKMIGAKEIESAKRYDVLDKLLDYYLDKGSENNG